MSFGVPIGAPYGLQIPEHDIRVTNRTGVALVTGNIAALDVILATAADNNNVGSKTSGLASLDTPVEGSMIGTNINVVLLEDIADGAEGMVRVYGRVKVMGGGTVDVSDTSGENVCLTVGADYKIHGVAADKQGMYAIGLEDLADDTLSEVLWNGFGWGNHAT